MKLVEFTYTKDAGEVSKRAVIEIITPTKFIEGWDITNLDEESSAVFMQQMSELRKVHYNQTMNLIAEFDLKHNYRRFKPENMSDVKVEYV